MAFKFKDLMVNVKSGGGGEDPICTVDTVKPAGQAYTCTVDTVTPAGQAATCTVDTVDPARAAYTCTVDTVIRGGGFRLDTGHGICTLDTVRPFAFVTVTTVTTVTTVVQALAPGAGSLAQLKGQLQQALADVERQEREQVQGLPETLEETDDLERRLQGAIQELREHRKTLEKAAKPRKGKK
jgi:hypothetical protein